MNGYAWCKDGFVPEQPGVKHDYLPEMVKLGHAEGMLVTGYFTIGCNPRWAELRPGLRANTGQSWTEPVERRTQLRPLLAPSGLGAAAAFAREGRRAIMSGSA